jgi:hypothetical protein
MTVEAEFEFATERRLRLAAVRGLGTGFMILAPLWALAGVVWIGHAFGKATLQQAVPNELAATAVVFLAPVALWVIGASFLLQIGRGLRRLLPWARWAALVILVPACVPPAMYFFSASRAGSYACEVLSLAILAPIALGALLLASLKTDLIFSPKYKEAAQRFQPYRLRPESQVSLGVKVVVIALSLVAMILLITLLHR